MKRRFLSWVLCLCLILCALPLHGFAEDPVSWELEGGTLSVTGAGRMRFRNIPWEDRLEEIKKITLDQGITGIQDGAFSGCTNLTSVTLPKNLRYIGSRAFEGCTSLCWVTLPESLIGIGDRAFAGCTKLTSVDIPAGVGRIGQQAFEPNIVCRGLKGSASEDYIKDCGGTFRQVNVGKEASGSGRFNGMDWQLQKGTLRVSGEGALNLGSLEGYPWDAMRADIREAVLEEGIAQVDEYAFALCRKLAKAELPQSLTKIAKGAFSEKTQILGLPGSPAQDYAQEAGLPFEALELPEAARAEEPLETAEPAETVEAAETTEPAETVEAAETTEPPETAEPADAAEAPEVTEAAGETEPAEEAKPGEEAPQAARPTLTVGTASGQPGQQVKVVISVRDNPGLCGLHFAIDYDHTRLTLEDYDCQDSRLTAADWSVGLGEGEKALWLQSDAMDWDGELLTLVFRISDAAPLGATRVNLLDITGVNEAAAAVKPACAAGEVTVTSGIPGDINGDGRVTAADEKRFRRYLSGASVSIELGNADLNGDGSADLLDLMLLQKR